MLVLPAADGAPATLIAPRLEATPAQACAAAAVARRDGRRLGGDRGPDALVARDPRGGARPPGRRASARSPCPTACGRRSCSGCSGVLPGARFSLASASCARSGCARTPTRSRCCGAAAQAADRVDRRRSPPGGWSGGPRRTSRARCASGWSPRATTQAEFWIVASGPNSASPHHEPGDRVIEAGEPIVIDIGGTVGGYASDIDAHDLGDRRRPGARPGRRLPPPVRRAPGRARHEATAAARPGVAVRAGRRRRARHHRRRRVRPDFIHRTGHGIGLEVPRGPVPRRGQRRAARARHGVQRRARDLPRGPVRRPDRGHRGLRRVRADRAQRGAAGPPGRRAADPARRRRRRPPGVSSADRLAPRPSREPNDD